jgi:hypothetical protein
MKLKKWIGKIAEVILLMTLIVLIVCGTITVIRLFKLVW